MSDSADTGVEMKVNVGTVVSILALMTACSSEGSKCEQVADIALQCFPVAEKQQKSEIAAQCEQSKTQNKFWAKQAIECIDDWTGDCDAFILCTDPDKLDKLKKNLDVEKREKREALRAKHLRVLEERANDTAYQHEQTLKKAAAKEKSEEYRLKREAKRAAAELEEANGEPDE